MKYTDKISLLLLFLASSTAMAYAKTRQYYYQQYKKAYQTEVEPVLETFVKRTDTLEKEINEARSVVELNEVEKKAHAWLDLMEVYFPFLLLPSFPNKKLPKISDEERKKEIVIFDIIEQKRKKLQKK